MSQIQLSVLDDARNDWAQRFVAPHPEGGWCALDETQAYEINEGVRYLTKADAVMAVLKYAGELERRDPRCVGDRGI